MTPKKNPVITTSQETPVEDQLTYQGGALSPISKERRDEAKLMFIAGASLTEISEALEINWSTLRSWSFREEWGVLRTTAQDKNLAVITAIANHKAREIAEIVLETLHKGVVRLSKRKDLDVDELHKLVAVHKSLVEGVLVSEGRPTKVTEQRKTKPDVYSPLKDMENIPHKPDPFSAAVEILNDEPTENT